MNLDLDSLKIKTESRNDPILIEIYRYLFELNKRVSKLEKIEPENIYNHKIEDDE